MLLILICNHSFELPYFERYYFTISSLLLIWSLVESEKSSDRPFVSSM